ncbi:MAG: hypothetical protein ACRDZ6_11195 [Acidimicrobiales bacterium]
MIGVDSQKHTHTAVAVTASIGPKKKALVAIERSILVVIHLRADPNVRLVDLGADFYERRVIRSTAPATSSVSPWPSATRSPSAPAPENNQVSGLRPERGSALHPGHHS